MQLSPEFQGCLVFIACSVLCLPAIFANTRAQGIPDFINVLGAKDSPVDGVYCMRLPHGEMQCGRELFVPLASLSERCRADRGQQEHDILGGIAHNGDRTVARDEPYPTKITGRIANDRDSTTMSRRLPLSSRQYTASSS